MSSKETTIQESKNGCYIGIDIGTQGTKAVLYHPQSQIVLQQESVSYDLAENPSKIEGRAEQDPLVWVNATKTVLKRLFSSSFLDASSSLYVEGIGVSGQQHGMVCLDANYQPIRNAKLWCDVEAHEESAEFSRQASQILKKPWNVPAGFTAPKVLWLKKNEYENFEKMKYCVLPHDYITFLLCGGGNENGSILPVTDAGDASGTGIFDPASREYISELTNIIDPKYEEMLPKVITQANAIAGYLSDEWKSVISKESQSYPKKIAISIGSGDNMCSALGVGCVEPQTAVLSLGTSGTIFGVSSTPIQNQNNSSVAPFCDATGRFLPLICIMSCTGVLHDVLNTFHDDNKKLTHEEATKLAQDVPKGCYGLIFLPFLNGERTPNWPHSKGSLMGMTSENLRYIHNPGVLYRAAMEGIGYTLRMGLDEIRKASSTNEEGKVSASSFETLLVVGGGSKNKLWRQIFADILNVTLKFPVEAESAALGASFQAGAACSGKAVEVFVLEQNVKIEDEIVKPSYKDEMHEVYRLGYDCFKKWSTKLYD